MRLTWKVWKKQRDKIVLAFHQEKKNNQVWPSSSGFIKSIRF
jgi:hypothetical protein